MASMFAAISGLQSSARWLDVISNNVSNSQTVGFKYARVTFTDLVNQGLSSGSGADNGSNLGGVNPMQLGLGVTVQSIQNIFTQGAIQTTGNATDVAIQGSGFFVVKKGNQSLYTRSGNFTFDNDGNMVNPDGGLVQGWNATFTRQNDPVTTRISATGYTLNTGDISQISKIQVPANLTLAPKQTGASLQTSVKDTGVIFSGNLDAKTPANANTGILRAAAAAFIVGGAGTATEASSGGVGITTVNALVGVNDPFGTVTPDHVTTATIYDSVGTPHSITNWFIQVGDVAATPPLAPQWAWFSFDTTIVQGSTVFTGKPSAANCIGGTGINNTTQFPAGSALTPATAYGLISFNADGSMATNGGPANLANAGQTNPVLAISNALGTAAGTAPAVLGDGAMDPFLFSMNFGTPNSYVAAGDSNGGNVFGAGIVAGSNGLRDGMTGDYGNGTTSIVGGVATYTPNSTAYVSKQDGYSEGVLVGVAVDQTGKINATFSNDQTIAVAQLAMASFNNAGGLAKIGGSYYQSTSNSGLASFGTAGSNGRGTMTGGALEASNVDLTIELTNMIVAQRMFESNARVITAADSVLNTLVNLGR